MHLLIQLLNVDEKSTENCSFAIIYNPYQGSRQKNK